MYQSYGNKYHFKCQWENNKKAVHGGAGAMAEDRLEKNVGKDKWES